MKGIAALVAILVLASCGPVKRSHFYDSEFVRIAEFQDHAWSDSLYRYFKSDDPAYRAAAALALASVQDTLSSPLLGNLLLEDKDQTVRRNAAFALGQTGGFGSVNALIPALTDRDPSIVREVLESLGKTVGKNDANTLRQFLPHDSLAQEGLAWGLYRLAQRGLTTEKDVKTEIEFLDPRYSVQTRTGAAWFFGRGPLKNFVPAAPVIRAARKDPVAEVRMAAAAGLRRLQEDSALVAIGLILKEESDYRVRINAIRSLTLFSIGKTLPIYTNALNDSNVNVGIAASEGLAINVNEPITELPKAIRSASNWRIQANLYRILMKVAPSPEVIEAIKKEFMVSRNNYQKAWLLGTLSSDPREFKFVSDALMNTRVPVIKSSAADALVAMDHSPNFPDGLRLKFAEVYKGAIADGDPAVVGSICNALSDSVLGYRYMLKDLNFLYEARAKMKLPRDIESMAPLDAAIAWLEGKPKPAFPKNEFNHPIAWDVVRSIAQHPSVLVKTNKGDITMRLLENEAPGSAANFAALVRQHYFDGRIFHRTVPNFVVQTGCNRGDGFGSEDYSIRSEFSGRRYTTGSVGMASAGKNTEGTQWFITHSPTPHLDGRYSIFAVVEKGMPVVDRIEVGDSILTVTLF